MPPQLFPISHLFRGEERVRNGQDGNERDRIGRDGKESSDGELLSVELSLFHAILRGWTNRRSDVGWRVRLYQTILGGAGGAKWAGDEGQLGHPLKVWGDPVRRFEKACWQRPPWHPWQPYGGLKRWSAGLGSCEWMERVLTNMEKKMREMRDCLQRWLSQRPAFLANNKTKRHWMIQMWFNAWSYQFYTKNISEIELNFLVVIKGGHLDKKCCFYGHRTF